MNELLLRRRVARMDSGPTEKSYIQDGLVFQLDGINKGNNVGYWTDLVGDVKFAFNSGSIVNANNVYFDGTNYITSSSINIRVAHGSCSIDVVCSPATAGIVFMPRQADITFGFNNNRIILIASTSQKTAYSYSNDNPSCFSCKSNACIQNGTARSSNGTGIFGGYDNYWHIGGRNNANKFLYTGNVFAIRIYNRQLSEEEMLFNQRIDNIRFNLGLTI